MTPEDHYSEGPIEIVEGRAAILKRPGMYLGDLQTGEAAAGVVRRLVQSVLRWQSGAQVTVVLTGADIEVTCRRLPPPDSSLHTEFPRRRPLQLLADGMAMLPSNGLDMLCVALACSHMDWEVRDASGEASARFEQDRCRAASRLAPGLPPALCLRVRARVGAPELALVPAGIDDVAQALRSRPGVSEAGYGGMVHLSDARSGEARTILVAELFYYS